MRAPELTPRTMREQAKMKEAAARQTMKTAGRVSCVGVVVMVLASCSYGQDLLRPTYCWDQDFRLDCNRTSMLAIHGASFTNDTAETNKSCSDVTEPGNTCTEDVRESVNRRCSGMSHCHYNLTEDYPERRCLGKGVLRLIYTCIPYTRVNRYCNTRVSGPKGYITSPGYPGFYPKVDNCSWTVEASNGQAVMVTVLDLATRPVKGGANRVTCPDALAIQENSHKLMHSCGTPANETLRPVVTSGRRVDVRFRSEDFSPSRGFLLYFKFHGCPTLAPPSLGYLAYRNGSSALYMCCKDHVFNDTLRNTRLLHCVDDFYWNASVTPCLTLEEILSAGNNGTTMSTGIKWKKNGEVVEVLLTRNKYIEDVLIPSALMVGLVFGNVALILVILKIRKKRKSSEENETLQPPTQGTGLHCPPAPVATLPRAPQVLMSDL